eukprot:3934133-Rhodomonas_salina.4
MKCAEDEFGPISLWINNAGVEFESGLGRPFGKKSWQLATDEVRSIRMFRSTAPPNHNCRPICCCIISTHSADHDAISNLSVFGLKWAGEAHAGSHAGRHCR